VEGNAESPGIPYRRRYLAHRRRVAATGEAARHQVSEQREVGQHLVGDGVLQGTPAESGASSDHYLCDPHNPVPTCGGGLSVNSPVCVDQRPVECRNDVLVHSSPVLEDGEALVGDVEATLFVSTNVRDTDIHMKLVDVYPDGTAFNVAETCLRLRYRDSLSEPTLLEPGTIYEIRLKSITTANYFAPEHQIRIEIAGSNFPLADRNWNTGGDNSAETSGPAAEVTLYHDASYQSRISYWQYRGPFTVGEGHRIFSTDGSGTSSTSQ
jgi:uncharacterized protein